jgi:hypothetical protein
MELIQIVGWAVLVGCGACSTVILGAIVVEERRRRQPRRGTASRPPWAATARFWGS